MKLTQNKIDEIVVEILGTTGLNLIKELKGKENVSEFTLASRLNKDIKIIRHMLYKLYNYSLVRSIRKKDKQKGWYIYYWTMVPDNIKYLYFKNKKNYLNKIKEDLQKEKIYPFFTCNNKCIRLDFDNSMDFEFRCPECGELLSQEINSTRLILLQKEIQKLENELKEEKEIKNQVKKKIKTKKKK